MIRNRQIEWMLFIAIILFFYPYLSLGFTTNDDAFNQVYHLWSDFKTNAITQGRVQFILAHWLIIKISFLIKNIFFIKFISICSVISNIIYFGYLIEKITKQRNLSYIFIISFITFLQDSWDHFLLTSSPLIYTVGFSLFLISFHLYLFYYTDKIKLILSAALFILAVQISEMFFLFSIFYILFSCLFLHKSIFFKLKYHFVFSIVYIVIYIGFRVFFGSVYEGNSIEHFSFINFFKTLSIYSLFTTPISLFLSHTTTGIIDINEYLNYPFDFRLSSNILVKVYYICIEIILNLDEINVIWLVRYLFFIAIISESLKKMPEVNKKNTVLLFVFSILLIFIPNVLHSLTGKYQDWALLYNAKGYVGSYFSYFGMILLLIILSIFLRRLGWFNHDTLVGKIKLVIIIGGVFIVSIITSISNETIFNQKKQSHYRWELIDKLFKNEAFKSIKDGDNIYTLGLTDSIGIVDQYISNGSADYWDRYTLMKTGKRVKFIDSIPENIKGNNNYVLKIIQNKNQYDTFAVFAKINSGVTSINNFYLLSVANGGNTLTYETKSGFKSFPFRLKGRKDFKLIKEKYVNIESIWVNYPIRNRNEHVFFAKPMKKGEIYTSRFDYHFSTGFYTQESVGIQAWNWGRKESSLLINNKGTQDIIVNLNFLLSTNQVKDYEISINLEGKHQSTIQAHTKDSDVLLSFNLKPGNNKIDFIAESSAKPLPTVFARDLYFKIKNLVITEVR
ncbi:MAG: hypothetical protein KAU26_06740 [Methylococcales bacterium]|nr:hypothetical protein [Methylococcales bacterium]